MRMHQGYLTILREGTDLAIILTFPLSLERNSRSSESIPQSFQAKMRKSFRHSMSPFSKITPLMENHMQADIEAQRENPRESAAVLKNEGDRNESVQSHYKVLVVDDSALVRKMAMKLLRSLGHSCDEADDGDVAVSLVRANGSYDMILMDNQMPRMTGEEATRIIRKELNFAGMIFGVTGNALAEDIQSFIDKGANEVIIKPLNADILEKAIQKFLAKDRPQHKDSFDLVYVGSYI